ncbi:hypothetical protein M8J77_006066 [Diaphorina citri]|nr:hypothetical protein M8J77_006066 [Diaphorina citri]
MWGLSNKVMAISSANPFGFVFTCVVLLCPVVFAGSGGNDISSATRIGGHPILEASGISIGEQTELSKCPRACTCVGLTIDCSHRGLTQVPGNLPINAERM